MGRQEVSSKPHEGLMAGEGSADLDLSLEKGHLHDFASLGSVKQVSSDGRACDQLFASLLFSPPARDLGP